MLKRTEFGKWAANFRIANDLMLRDMAERLEVSASFLSNVEHGRKKVPDDWFDLISEKLQPDLAQAANLRVAIMRTNRLVTVELETPEQVQVMVAFEKNKDLVTKDIASKFERLLTQ